jgi:hypothetical protein
MIVTFVQIHSTYGKQRAGYVDNPTGLGAKCLATIIPDLFSLLGNCNHRLINKCERATTLKAEDTALNRWPSRHNNKT